VITAQRVGLAIVFLWFFLGGVGHFLFADFFVGIVPPNVKGPETAVAVSGLFELLGALGILLPVTRRVAGVGLFVLTLVVTAANLHMWVHFDQFPEYSPALLGLRLVVQVFLLALILFSTQPLRPRASA
jgi:uncharacterized membrane protein